MASFVSPHFVRQLGPAHQAVMYQRLSAAKKGSSRPAVPADKAADDVAAAASVESGIGVQVEV